MFGFGSPSSSRPEIEKPAPSREERKACWNSRDIYFGCLDKNKILQAGDEIRTNTKGDVIPGQVCSAERKGYENSCAKAWVSDMLSSIFLTRQGLTDVGRLLQQTTDVGAQEASDN